MKHLLLSSLMCLLLFGTSQFVQAQNVPFQGTAISSLGQVLTSQTITVRLSVFNDIASGSAAYVETQTVTTSATGAFSVQVGTGTAVTGTYASVNLMSSVHFLQVEIKPASGSYNTISKGPIAQSIVVCPPNPPTTPTAGTHVASTTQIVWNWNSVADATAYKWNTVNDFSTATDIGAALTKTETALTCNTAYTRYVWAYTVCGHSAVLTVNQTTSACNSSCGSPITVNHVAGTIAPVSKTVTYGVVGTIAGETTKCWITSNLGADHQGTAVDDATEPSAGWYWQFNLKQGRKHDGTILTPAWIMYTDENSDWLTANDPCSELGSGWRIPTMTEWINVNTAGNWTEWSGPWNSGLKLHAAGFLMGDGSLVQRGSTGDNWSSLQEDASIGMAFLFNSGGTNSMNYNYKGAGFSVRCIKDATVSSIPTLTTTSITAIAQTTATGGGNVTADGGATVSARGICWSTSSNPSITDSHTTDGSGTGIFVSNLTGLTANTLYHVRAYATNSAGTAYGSDISFTTCGSSLTINHVAGAAAPVSKTVTYGIVGNIPGANTKCWITSNLGADQQATAFNDATEASAGWFWQFNRKQGYKNDGTTVTPAWTIPIMNESSKWLSANDSCTSELGSGWRLPTSTEWTNVNASGNWTNKIGRAHV